MRTLRLPSKWLKPFSKCDISKNLKNLLLKVTQSIIKLTVWTPVIQRADNFNIQRTSRYSADKVLVEVRRIPWKKLPLFKHPARAKCLLSQISAHTPPQNLYSCGAQMCSWWIFYVKRATKLAPQGLLSFRFRG